MGKPIAGMGDLPYNIGGFCITAANIDGDLKYNLNIFQQRSSTIFDLIDTDFNVYTFISITNYSSDNKKLIPTETAEEIAQKLNKNTFVIKVDDAFISSFQSNKIKLSNGLMKYEPWDLYYCNIPTETASLDIVPLSAKMAINEKYRPDVVIKPKTFSKSIIWSTDDPSIATVDENGNILGISDGRTIVTATSAINSRIKDTMELEVNYIPVTGVQFKSGFGAVHINAGNSLVYEIEILPSNATNKEIKVDFKHINHYYDVQIVDGNKMIVSAPLSSDGISVNNGITITVGSEERNDLYQRVYDVIIYVMDEF